jgi:hypothetical protein
MSLFTLFKNTKTAASIICEKNDVTNDYDCKIGFDTENTLFKTNGFKHKESFCNSQVETFIQSLGAIDTGNVTYLKRWIFFENNKNNGFIDIYSFNRSREIHIIKYKKIEPNEKYILKILYTILN